MDTFGARRPLGNLSSNLLNERGKGEREVVNKRVLVKRGSNDGRNQRGLVIIARILMNHSFEKWKKNAYTYTITPSYADIISNALTGNKESIFEVEDNIVEGMVNAHSINDGIISSAEEIRNIKQDIITPKKRRFYSNTEDDVVEINTTATSAGGIRTNMSNIGTPSTTALGGIRADNSSINNGTPLPLFGTNKSSSSHTTPTGTFQFPNTLNSINRVDNKVNTPFREGNLFENIEPNKIPVPLEKLIDDNDINGEVEAHKQSNVEYKERPKRASSQEKEHPTVASNNATVNRNSTEFPLAKDFEALHYAMVEATTASIKSLLLHHNARSGGSGSKLLQSRETVSYVETEYQDFSPNVDVKSVADSFKPVILSPLGHQGQPSGSTPYVPLCELSIYQEKLKSWKEKYGKEENNSSSGSNVVDTTVIDDINIENAIDGDSFVTTLY